MTISTPREAIEAAAQCAPCTAENPNENEYQRGRFDAIMEYQAAIRAIPVAEPGPVEAGGLLPCPFCGGEMMERHALWASDGDVDAVIHKPFPITCGLIEFSINSCDQGVSTAAAWNARASIATPDPLTAKLVEALQNIRALAQKRQNERGFEGGVLEDIAGFARAALAAAEGRG